MIDVFPILAATDPQAAAESVGLAEKFGIHVGHIVMQLISFAILAFVLYRFAFKPVFATLDERNAKIADGLKYAEDMKQQLADAQEEKKRVLQEASVEAKKLIEEARQAAESRIEKASQEAIQQAEGILTKAEQQIELDRQKMLSDARSEIARLVVATTSKVLSRDLSSDERNRFLESASSDLASSQN